MSADDKAAAAWDDYIDQQQEEKIEELERELNAANQRIKRLEDGDAALTYSIGLDLQKENEALKARIQRLEEAGDEMAKFCNPTSLRLQWHKAKEDKL